jgi:hypothetical protein
MNYMIVESDSSSGLEQKVRHAIASGWLPVGGVSVAANGALNWWYYQAMTKSEESKRAVE